MDDLRSEIRTAFEKEQAAHPPLGGLRSSLTAAAISQARPAPNLQWIAIVAAAALGILVVVGLMSTHVRPRANVPAPAVTTPSPSPTASEASPAPITVASADSLIRLTVTGAHPLLLPSTIPQNWSAVVTYLSSSFFSVTYTSPDSTKEVDFAIVVPNPGPPGPRGSQSNPRFHGDPHSLYQVDDKTQGISPRFLMWNEPGTWSEPNGLPGVPYALSTTGLTDAEFWAIANSLRA
jgi:hypothetical protein